jgi:hypothetical protein
VPPHPEGYRLKKTCLVYLKDDEIPIVPKHIERDPEKRHLLEKFKDTVRSRHTVASFKDAHDLSLQVTVDLSKIAHASSLLDSLEGLFAKSAPGGRQIGIIAKVFEGDSLLAEKVFTNISAANTVGSPVEFENLRIEIVAHPVGGGASRQAKISI